MKKVQFVIDDAYHFKEITDLGMYGSHSMLGAYHFDKKNWCELVEPKDIKSGMDVIIFNYPALIMKGLGKLGKKSVLININSNQVITKAIKNPKKSFISALQFFSVYDDIVCLSVCQVEPLKKFLNNLPSTLIQLLTGRHPKIHVIPAAIDETMIRQIEKQNLKQGNYYLTSGKDAGRVFKFNIKDKTIKIKAIGNGNSLPYNLYLKELLQSKGLILKSVINSKSSDLSGVTTFMEGLVAKKPVFINPQPWLQDYPMNNVYVYKSDKELEKLLKQNIQWKECDLSYFLMPRYLKELKKVIYNN